MLVMIEYRRVDILAQIETAIISTLEFSNANVLAPHTKIPIRILGVLNARL